MAIASIAFFIESLTPRQRNIFRLLLRLDSSVQLLRDALGMGDALRHE